MENLLTALAILVALFVPTVLIWINDRTSPAEIGAIIAAKRGSDQA
jgi:hypothetical protein